MSRPTRRSLYNPCGLTKPLWFHTISTPLCILLFTPLLYYSILRVPVMDSLLFPYTANPMRPALGFILPSPPVPNGLAQKQPRQQGGGRDSEDQCPRKSRTSGDWPIRAAECHPLHAITPPASRRPAPGRYIRQPDQTQQRAGGPDGEACRYIVLQPVRCCSWCGSLRSSGEWAGRACQAPTCTLSGLPHSILSIREVAKKPAK